MLVNLIQGGDWSVQVRTSDGDKRIVVGMGRAGGTGTIERTDTEVQGFKGTLSMDEDDGDPRTGVLRCVNRLIWVIGKDSPLIGCQESGANLRDPNMTLSISDKKLSQALQSSGVEPLPGHPSDLVTSVCLR